MSQLKEQGPRRARMTARVVVAALIIALLLWFAGVESVFEAFLGMDLRLLAGLYIASILVRVVEAHQMAVLLRRAGSYVRWLRVVLANLLSSFYALVAPGDIIASGAKWSNLSAATGKRSLVLNAMVYNRLALLSTTIAIGLMAFTWENPIDSAWARWVLLVPLVIIAVLGTVLWHPRLEWLLRIFIRPIDALLPAAVSRRIEMTIASLRSFRGFSWQDHVHVWTIGFLATAVAICSSLFAFWAVGIDVPITTILWIRAVLVASRQLPITVNGIGVREGLLVLLLSPYGVPAAAAVAVGLVKFSSAVMVGVIGGVYQLALVAGWARWKGDPYEDTKAEGVDARPRADASNPGTGSTAAGRGASRSSRASRADTGGRDAGSRTRS